MEDEMDEPRTRAQVGKHAGAVERGETDSVVADFTKDLRPQVPQIAQALLPQPVTVAEVLSVEIGRAESVAMMRYIGDSGDVTIRERWREENGCPVIFAAEPAS
jgi:hypothetical protein